MHICLLPPVQIARVHFSTAHMNQMDMAGVSVLDRISFVSSKMTPSISILHGASLRMLSVRRFDTLDECNEPRPGAPGLGCWWVDDSCKLALYGATYFAIIAPTSVTPEINALGSTLKLTFRHFCGESTADFEQL